MVVCNRKWKKRETCVLFKVKELRLIAVSPVEWYQSSQLTLGKKDILKKCQTPLKVGYLKIACVVCVLCDWMSGKQR